MSTAKALQLDNVLPFSLHVDVEGDTIWLRMRASRKQLFETAIVCIFLLGVIPFIWLPDLAPYPLH